MEDRIEIRFVGLNDFRTAKCLESLAISNWISARYLRHLFRKPLPAGYFRLKHRLADQAALLNGPHCRTGKHC